MKSSGNESDVPTFGLNMVLKKVSKLDEAMVEKGQRWNMFQSQCKIKDTSCKVLIDGGSYTNAISMDLVQALGLPMWRHPQPHHVEWLYNSGRLKITHKVRVSFSIGDYVDKVIVMSYLWMHVNCCWDGCGSMIMMLCIVAGPIISPLCIMG